jgi:hypothetical protein
MMCRQLLGLRIKRYSKSILNMLSWRRNLSNRRRNSSPTRAVSIRLKNRTICSKLIWIRKTVRSLNKIKPSSTKTTHWRLKKETTKRNWLKWSRKVIKKFRGSKLSSASKRVLFRRNSKKTMLSLLNWRKMTSRFCNSKVRLINCFLKRQI